MVRHFPSVRRVFRKRGRWLINPILPAKVVNFPLLARGNANRLHISARMGPLPRGDKNLGTFLIGPVFPSWEIEYNPSDEG